VARARDRLLKGFIRETCPAQCAGRMGSGRGGPSTRGGTCSVCPLLRTGPVAFNAQSSSGWVNQGVKSTIGPTTDAQFFPPGPAGQCHQLSVAFTEPAPRLSTSILSVSKSLKCADAANRRLESGGSAGRGGLNGEILTHFVETIQ
jgi:hypothetical protein